MQCETRFAHQLIDWTFAQCFVLTTIFQSEEAEKKKEKTTNKNCLPSHQFGMGDDSHFYWKARAHTVSLAVATSQDIFIHLHMRLHIFTEFLSKSATVTQFVDSQIIHFIWKHFLYTTNCVKCNLQNSISINSLKENLSFSKIYFCHNRTANFHLIW